MTGTSIAIESDCEVASTNKASDAAIKVDRSIGVDADDVTYSTSSDDGDDSPVETPTRKETAPVLIICEWESASISESSCDDSREDGVFVFAARNETKFMELSYSGITSVVKSLSKSMEGASCNIAGCSGTIGGASANDVSTAIDSAYRVYGSDVSDVCSECCSDKQAASREAT